MIEKRSYKPYCWMGESIVYIPVLTSQSESWVITEPKSEPTSLIVFLWWLL